MVVKPILYLLLIALVLSILAAWLGAGVGLYVGGDFLQSFVTTSPWLNYALVAQIFLLVSIPILLIALSLYGLLRNRAKSIKPIKKKLDYIWIANFVLLFVWVAFVSRDLSQSHNHRTSDVLNRSATPMMLKINSPKEPVDLVRVNTPLFKLYDNHFYQHASIAIKQSKDDNVQINRCLSARGKDVAAAQSRIDNMSYHYALDSLTIEIADYFELGKQSTWRGQFMHYDILLPIGQKIVLADTDDFASMSFDCAEAGISPNRYPDKTWEMTEAGLKCLDCQSI